MAIRKNFKIKCKIIKTLWTYIWLKWLALLCTDPVSIYQVTAGVCVCVCACESVCVWSLTNRNWISFGTLFFLRYNFQIFPLFFLLILSQLQVTSRFTQFTQRSLRDKFLAQFSQKLTQFLMLLIWRAIVLSWTFSWWSTCLKRK